MKGLSILLSMALLVLAHQLARHLKKSGTLPAQQRNRPTTLASGPAGPDTRAHRVDTRLDL